MAKHPAAFINAIAEDGTKDEAVRYLQSTWDDLCDLRATVARQRGLLQEAAVKFSLNREFRAHEDFALNLLRRIEAELDEQVRT